MNGKRAKQIRKASGISIQARREQAAFARVIDRAINDRSDVRAKARRARRQVLAWAALAVIVACLLGVLFL